VSDIQAELLAAEAALALRSPLDFGKYVNRRDKYKPESSVYEEYAYAKMLSDLVVRFLADPTAKYLLLSGPIRHGKSWALSRTVPAWYLANNPDHHVILAGYGSSFASTWGRFTRDQIARHPELGIGIDPSARSVEYFSLSHPHVGTMTATGVGGGIIGKGAHLYLIDDPLKNPEEALSDTYRTKQEDWFWTAANGRLEPGGKLILTMARWHFADLFGYLWDRLPRENTWRVETPALADGNPFDPTGREEGEALVPQRYPAKKRAKPDGQSLEETKATIDPWVWASQYQCSPQAEEGGLFAKSGRRSYSTTPTHFILSQPDAPPVFLDRNKTRRFVTADLAATTKTANDWTVFSVWEAARLPQSEVSVILLTGVVRTRMDSADHLDTALDVWRRFRPLFMGVEKATYGLTLLTQLQRKGVPVRELIPDKDKVSRAIPASSAWNAGRVYLPVKEELEVVEELVEEATQFPNGKHDDWTDTLGFAVIELDTGAIGGSLGAFRPAAGKPQEGTVAWLRQRSKPKRRKPVGL
jgi:predicted phage terminase large subunit-like protein